MLANTNNKTILFYKKRRLFQQAVRGNCRSPTRLVLVLLIGGNLEMERKSVLRKCRRPKGTHFWVELRRSSIFHFGCPADRYERRECWRLPVFRLRRAIGGNDATAE